MMDFSIWTQIRLNFVLKFVLSQFLKNVNFFNGKLSKKNITQKVFRQISSRSFNQNERNRDEQNNEMNKIKNELTHLQQ